MNFTCDSCGQKYGQVNELKTEIRRLNRELKKSTMRESHEADMKAELQLECNELNEQIKALTAIKQSLERQLIAFSSAWPGGVEEVDASIESLNERIEDLINDRDYWKNEAQLYIGDMA